jgi:hypothetical protein
MNSEKSRPPHAPTPGSDEPRQHPPKDDEPSMVENGHGVLAEPQPPDASVAGTAPTTLAEARALQPDES